MYFSCASGTPRRAEPSRPSTPVSKPLVARSRGARGSIRPRQRRISRLDCASRSPTSPATRRSPPPAAFLFGVGPPSPIAAPTSSSTTLDTLDLWSTAFSPWSPCAPAPRHDAWRSEAAGGGGGSARRRIPHPTPFSRAGWGAAVWLFGCRPAVDRPPRPPAAGCGADACLPPPTDGR